MIQQTVALDWRLRVRIQVTLELRFEWWGKTRHVGMGRSVFQREGKEAQRPPGERGLAR